MFESHLKPPISFPTVSGATCTFNSQYAGLPLTSCTSLISGYQEGTGTPAPTNVRNLVSFSSGTLTANSNTYTFTFGQDIYSGSIDWLRSKAVIDYIVKTIDENTEGITIANGILLLDDFFDISEDEDSTLCNYYQRISNRSSTSGMSGAPDYSFCCKTGGSNTTRIMIKDTRFTTVDDYKTWLTTNPVKISVKLAAPIEMSFGDINLTTIQGTNTISANTGDTTLQYIKLG